MLDASETLKITRQMLQALQALHDLGIVHRDLKPSNVFLTRHGVKLLDFGRRPHYEGRLRLGPQRDRNRRIRRWNHPWHTFVYIARTGKRSVGWTSLRYFSVGSVFYELLTGKRPFECNSLVDILYAVLHQNPPPLSGSREAEALDRILRRAMAKRVEDRYTSAHEMLEALNSSLFPKALPSDRARAPFSALIVLPFRAPKSDEQTDFLTFALPEAIGNSLSAMNNLIVRSSLLAVPFEGQPDPKRVAVEADVDAFLTGYPVARR